MIQSIKSGGQPPPFVDGAPQRLKPHTPTTPLLAAGTSKRSSRLGHGQRNVQTPPVIRIGDRQSGSHTAKRGLLQPRRHSISRSPRPPGPKRCAPALHSPTRPRPQDAHTETAPHGSTVCSTQTHRSGAPVPCGRYSRCTHRSASSNPTAHRFLVACGCAAEQALPQLVVAPLLLPPPPAAEAPASPLFDGAVPPRSRCSLNSARSCQGGFAAVRGRAGMPQNRRVPHKRGAPPLFQLYMSSGPVETSGHALPWQTQQRPCPPLALPFTPQAVATGRSQTTPPPRQHTEHPPTGASHVPPCAPAAQQHTEHPPTARVPPAPRTCSVYAPSALPTCCLCNRMWLLAWAPGAMESSAAPTLRTCCSSPQSRISTRTCEGEERGAGRSSTSENVEAALAS